MVFELSPFSADQLGADALSSLPLLSFLRTNLKPLVGFKHYTALILVPVRLLVVLFHRRLLGTGQSVSQSGFYL